jgi:uncharacterized protein
MPALCDVNFLFVLITNRHEHHRRAAAWMERAGTGHAVICRHAQLGLFRLLSNPAILREEALRSDDCWKVWQKLTTDERLRFAADEPGGLDPLLKAFTERREFTPKLWTDAYLAAFAKASNWSVVTFDSGFRQFPGIDLELL